MRKTVKCVKCGVHRYNMIKVEIIDQRIMKSIKLKPLCMCCFVNIVDGLEIKKESKNKFQESMVFRR